MNKYNELLNFTENILGIELNASQKELLKAVLENKAKLIIPRQHLKSFIKDLENISDEM